MAAWAEVALSVYQLHGTSGINAVTSIAGLGGAYHVAVQVYGLEWSYGASDHGTGIYMVHIGESTLGNFMERVPLGKTKKTPEQVLEQLGQWRKEYHGTDYGVLTNNCAHFSVAFTKWLGVADAPDWVNSLAGAGAAITGSKKDLSATSRFADEEDLEAYDDDDLRDFAQDGDQLAMLELVWRYAQEYTRDWVLSQENAAKFEDVMIEIRWVVPRGDVNAYDAAEDLAWDARLKPAIGKAAAVALRLNWDKEDPDIQCPVKVIKMHTYELRTSATCRVTGSKHLANIKIKPKPEEFAGRFKSELGNAVQWTKEYRTLIANMQLDTAPGQPALSKRVQTNSGKSGRGAEIYFPRQEFKTPESVHGTLQRLEQARKKISDQTVSFTILGRLDRSFVQDQTTAWSSFR